MNSGNTKISVNDATQIIQVTAGNGLQFTDSTVKYASSYITNSTPLDTTSTYAQTFDGTTLIATLPVVDGDNVGTQYLITNTNASTLTVNSSGQNIYSVGSTATTRSLLAGDSRIFTAIITTSVPTYGWSMV